MSEAEFQRRPLKISEKENQNTPTWSKKPTGEEKEEIKTGQSRLGEVGVCLNLKLDFSTFKEV